MQLVAYLLFDGNAEEAFDFYARCALRPIILRARQRPPSPRSRPEPRQKIRSRRRLHPNQCSMRGITSANSGIGASKR